MPMPYASAQQRLQSLLDLMHLVMRAVDPDEVLTTILTAARRWFEAEGCSLALLDPTTHELAFVTMVGPAQVEAFRLPLGQGIAGWVAQTGHGVVCNDVTQDARFFRGVDQQIGYTTRSLLCAPLQQYDRLLGVIEVHNTTRPASATPSSAGSSSSQVADAPLHHRARPACLAVTSEHRAPAAITGQARRSRMTDKTEERQAIVIALTTEQTEYIWVRDRRCRDGTDYPPRRRAGAASAKDV